MKPFPADEWKLLEPLTGVSRMLELGNKKNHDGVYKAAFEAMGIEHVSVDWNGEDGALKLDLRVPQWETLGQFDMVTNFGTTEHVASQKGVWENIHRCLKVGGTLISMTPFPGDWSWHGEFYPTEDFYWQLAQRNGYVVERLYVDREPPRRNWYCRMRKEAGGPFLMPDLTTIYRNR